MQQILSHNNNIVFINNQNVNNIEYVHLKIDI